MWQHLLYPLLDFQTFTLVLEGHTNVPYLKRQKPQTLYLENKISVGILIKLIKIMLHRTYTFAGPTPTGQHLHGLHLQ